MNITVIICTYNRGASLAKTLESVAASALPASVVWEILVVDNNSRDQTREVVEECSRNHSGLFRYLFEPQQGKSHALNSGIREARGEVLAFTDDDVTVEPTWLQNLTAPFEDGQWAGTAGRILPARTFEQPSWFSLEGPQGLGGALCGFFDLGDQACEMDKPAHGANMAFQKSMLEKYGGFRADLGPSRDVVQGEDTELGRRLLDAGQRLRYEPLAVVYHPIDEKRLNKDYFLAWWFAYGRSITRTKPGRPPLIGIPRHYISILNLTLRVLPLRTLRWILTISPRRKFWQRCRVWAAAGETVELWRLSFSANGNAEVSASTARTRNA